MEASEIARLQRLGLTEKTAEGREAARASVSLDVPDAAKADMSRLRAALEARLPELGENLAAYGAEMIPGSLVPIAQMAEVRVPLDTLDAAETALAQNGMRLTVTLPHKMNDP